jgi:FtsP/CotA-like multicopper oxidase with cupredoxin domain
MHHLIFFTATLVVVASSVSAYESEKLHKIPEDHIIWGSGGKPFEPKVHPRQTTSSPSSQDVNCQNGPLTRGCWVDGFSIGTDFDLKWPITNGHRHYDLEITNTTCNFDGHGDKVCMLINNQYPGPTITANWGDMIYVNVKNSLPNNGTSIHWHGMRQLGTNVMDGVNGITECPIAPGDSKTYAFQATQYGSSWYHSHFSIQYGDGVVGAIVIHGPASANYDIDLGPYPVTDWYYTTADQLAVAAEAATKLGAPPPAADTILINGTNMNSEGGGKYSYVRLTKGKKHLLRLINTSIDNMIWVSLDGHPFEVITADLIPIRPFQTRWLLLAIGQRYDVVINANQTSGNYWFRADHAKECASDNRHFGRAVFTYSDSNIAIPVSKEITDKPNSNCSDPLAQIIPVWNTSVPKEDWDEQIPVLAVDLTASNITTNNQNIVAWGINMTAIDVDWRKPTLQYVVDGNDSFPYTYNLIELAKMQIWTFWIIQETTDTQVPIPHPMHLHGHDVSTSFPCGLKTRLTSGPVLHSRNRLGHLRHKERPRETNLHQPTKT